MRRVPRCVHQERISVFSDVLGLLGTAADIADQMEHYMDDGSADGFMLAATYTPGCFEEFADYVVPELQRRGRFRTKYTRTTLRENLLAT